MFGGPHQGLPDRGDILCVGDLHQVEEVREVRAELFRCALALFIFADVLIFQARLAKFHCHLPDHLSNPGARRTIYAWV